MPQENLRTTREAVTGRIAAAARLCFARSGVQGTRMEDVARSAGLSRATVYRFVTGRDELIEHVLVERTREMGRQIEADMVAVDDVQDAVIEVMIRAIDLSRTDPEYNALTDVIPKARLNAFFTTARSPIHDVLRIPLLPLLDRARSQRILRSDLSDDEIIEWIQGVMFLLWPRADLDDAALARFVRRFAFPAIFPIELPR